jgi:hypothetical protein
VTVAEGERPSLEPLIGPIVAGWRRIDETPGHAYARVVNIARESVYEGWEVAAGPTGGWAVRFRLVVDASSIARALEVDADGPHGWRRLSMRRDPKGRWWADGKRRLDLDECLDADVAATPLTNTPTIRRLDLAAGESADIQVAWVDIPSLTVTAAPQGYDRLAADEVGGLSRYRFRATGIDGLVLTTDPDGIVRDYERFAERVFRR